MLNKEEEEKLTAFIEKPSQEYWLNPKDTEEQREKNLKELAENTDLLVKVLSENNAKKAQAIMNIITGHPFIPGSDLLADLADKMKHEGKLEKLAPLFEHCFNSIIEHCTHNTYDLARCIEVSPSHRNQIMDSILKTKYFPRILESQPGKPKEEILEKLKTDYPDYSDRLSGCYIVEYCIHNTDDLAGWIKASPSHRNQIMDAVLEEKYFRRILESQPEKPKEEILEKLKTDYPDYSDRLAECYRELYPSRTLKMG